MQGPQSQSHPHLNKMIISPPFLPTRGPTQSVAAWLDTAMAPSPSRLADTRAAEGSFPLSHGLAWHNGMHLQAPTGEGGASLPVRAIADGRVIFVHAPTTPVSLDVQHAQNYNPFPRGVTTAAWSDNGCVILEHSTEIGSDATPTAITFYSLYMHLSELGRIVPAGQTTRRALQTGDYIWRKDEIGSPGQIYGAEGQIHFEICCNKDNLEQLIGRVPTWVERVVAPAVPPEPTADGRTDSIFGSLYFYLPSTTPTHIGTTAPSPPLRRGLETPGTKLESALWVKLTYERGTCTSETFDLYGTSLRRLDPEPTFEYDLYEKARSLHEALPPAKRNQSSASGWFELLRFGRNIGRGATVTDKDPLPEDAAHWRRVAGADGRAVWADLNAPGSFKFSDADFLAIAGWTFVDDDAKPTDQRCDSAHLKELIADPDHSVVDRLSPEVLALRLGTSEVRERLRRAVCKFPSEWNRATASTGYAFAEDVMSVTEDDTAWPRFQAHLRAMTFEGLPTDFLLADRRLHPREFIEHLRNCLWLSERELKQLLPTYAMRKHNGVYLWEGIVLEASRQGVIRDHREPLNRALRKWSIDTRIRMVTFFGNSVQETQWWAKLAEGSGSTLWYAPWYGRGFMQLTNPENYIFYWRYRGRVVAEPLKVALAAAYTHVASLPGPQRSNAGLQDVHFPALTTDMKMWREQVASNHAPKTAEDFLAPSDSAGYYWARNAMAAEADPPHVLQRVSITTDHGPKVYYRSPSFWRASATVNLPAAVTNTYSSHLNGFDARCVAYTNALSVLTETRFPDAHGLAVLDTPETNTLRRTP